MMAEDGIAGPSRPKRSKVQLNNYCGLDPKEAAHLLQLLSDENSDNELEEPFADSGSEYELESESEESADEENIIDEDIVDEANEIPNDIRDDDDSQEGNPGGNETDHSDINITWTKNNFQPILHTFNSSYSGIQGDVLNQASKEIDYFFNLITEDVTDLIITETNRYARQQDEKKWKDIDLPELSIFLALTMLMSRNKKLDMKEYWSKDPLLNSPIFGKQMPRDRYLQIKRCLHFADNENAPTNNRLYKIETLLQMIKKRLADLFHPFQDLVIDESMVLFKGRLSFKQYIKTKRHRFGIKLYVLCDCETGIVQDFVVYIGQQTNIQVRDVKGLGSSGSVVAALMDPYLHKGHSLFTDNYYSSPILSTYLHENETNSSGTVRANRKHMPVLNSKLKKGDIDWRCSDKILVMKWKDRRDVSMITTMHENKMVNLDKVDKVTGEPVKKPLCVVDYNGKMGAVDRSDMMISSIECMRKSNKWYKKLFYHVMDICMLNSHAMYSLINPEKVPLAKFQLNLIRQILEKYSATPIVAPQHVRGLDVARLTGRHFPVLVPDTPKSKNPLRRCIVCSQTKLAPKKRKESRYMCKDCDVGLCVVPCFATYHTMSKF
ncbi:piggyBac transposable element-derived protein 4-like [Photinus pyralis]|uniref:PiggyBac transposable element-derived protein domain-containing protein n=4 Tax=Photinus pyralis TaxID=7054 RepID=A0A1Y1K821_PHOPY|nr:piggyBac transposable element-derived protein 4-like [Photinus pyralis]XP_031350748.1 piggyBac transposable element-derived protein 4-like [Photinus pyralis]XP_031350749.1 piggyBac transposable element-derived protein 4-like [Photinus pyralis]XP_031352199.1 piggyBac transposable element-derived protein 4-like [Photinus pyralis]